MMSPWLGGIHQRYKAYWGKSVFNIKNIYKTVFLGFLLSSNIPEKLSCVNRIKLVCAKVCKFQSQPVLSSYAYFICTHSVLASAFGDLSTDPKYKRCFTENVDLKLTG